MVAQHNCWWWYSGYIFGGHSTRYAYWWLSMLQPLNEILLVHIISSRCDVATRAGEIRYHQILTWMLWDTGTWPLKISCCRAQYIGCRREAQFCISSACFGIRIFQHAYLWLPHFLATTIQHQVIDRVEKRVWTVGASLDRKVCMYIMLERANLPTTTPQKKYKHAPAKKPTSQFLFPRKYFKLQNNIPSKVLESSPVQMKALF